MRRCKHRVKVSISLIWTHGRIKMLFRHFWVSEYDMKSNGQIHARASNDVLFQKWQLTKVFTNND